MTNQLLTREETEQKLLQLIHDSEMDDADLAQMFGFMLIAYCSGNGHPKKAFIKVLGNWWDYCMSRKKDFTTH